MPPLRLLSALCLLLPWCVCTISQCFDRTPDHILVQSARAKPKKLSLKACQEQCLDPRGDCRSVLYFTKLGVCLLNAASKDDRPEKFLHSKAGVDYYQRVCYHAPSKRMAAWQNDNPLLDSCFATVKGKVLIGIVDQLLDGVGSMESCKQSCLAAKTTSGTICKSAMWYAKEKECIIASQDKADIAELYIDDPSSVYLENKCSHADNAETTSAAAPEKPPTTLATLITSPKDDLTLQNVDEDDETEETEPFRIEGEHPFSASNASTDAPPSQSPAVIIEQSGYDAPSSAINSSLVTQTARPAPVIDPAVIDSYQMPSKVERPPPANYFGKTQAAGKAAAKAHTPPAAKLAAAVDEATHTQAQGYVTESSAHSNLSQDEFVTVTASAAYAEKLPLSSVLQTTPSIEVKPSLGVSHEQTTLNSVGGYDAGVMTQSSTAASKTYRRRLRDDRMSKCFSQVYPSVPLLAGRIMKAYSLEQCVDICRLCTRCLKGLRCAGIAFDSERENCLVTDKKMLNDDDSRTSSLVLHFARNPEC